MIYLFVLLATISSLYFTIFSKDKLTKKDKMLFNVVYLVSYIISIFYYLLVGYFTLLPIFGFDFSLISFVFMVAQLTIVYAGVYLVIFVFWRLNK